MQSRTKWWLLPIAALVVAGGATGWWGYGQHTGRQALAAEVQVQYNHSFHALIGHIEDMQDEIQNAKVSGEQDGFQSHVRSIWRLSDLASADVARMPLNIMPMHKTQQFLAEVGKDTDEWLRTGVSHSNKSVDSRLQWMSVQSKNILAQLNKVETTTQTKDGTWTGAIAALSGNQKDNQVVDGFHKLDASVSGYPETKQAQPSIRVHSNDQSASQPAVSQTKAKKVVANAIHGVNVKDLTVKRADFDNQPIFAVDDKAMSDFYAEVSVHGGHLLSMRRPNNVRGGDKLSVGEAADDAGKWLKTQGFASTEESQSHVYNHTAYFIWSPVVKGAVVLDHDLTIAISLQNGRLVAYNAKTAILDPVTSVGKRKYTAAQLKKGIDLNFQVRETRQSVVKASDGHFIPTVSFYGLYDGKPYRVDMNAETGHEQSISPLISL